MPPQKAAKEVADLEDKENRDPNDLNHHLEVAWEDVIGEPETVQSPEFIWNISQQCFRISKGCSYACLTALFAPLAAFCLGFSFACIAFKHIWCILPCLRVWKISCAATRSFVTSCMEAVVVPTCESLGTFWSKMKVRWTNFASEKDKRSDVIPI